MKIIYLIFIVACLTEQLKADEFIAEVFEMKDGDKFLATLKEDPDYIVTMLDDFSEKGAYLKTTLTDQYGYEFFYPVAKQTCDLDPEELTGTLAAIYWGTLGIASCPVKAGVYPVVRKFNITGVMPGMYAEVGEPLTIGFELYNWYNARYISLTSHVTLVEGERSVGDFPVLTSDE